VKGLKIATMDPEKNEVTFAKHESFPTVVHFTKTNKRGRKIKFKNRKGKQIEGLVEYLSKYSDAYMDYKKANPDFDPVELAKTFKAKPEAEYKKEWEAKKKEEEAAAKKKRDEEAAA